MKPAKLLLFVMLFAMACSEKEENPGDFGEIQIPDVGQLDQTIGLEGTEKPASITFRTADAWTSTIVQTRADAPDWISISPDHGDQAGSYTIQIDVKPNDTGAERSAVVSIRCNNSEVNVSVTQEFEEPSMRTTLGRLARITEYENDKIESVAVFSYDEEERILSVITYLDADLSQKAESWEFSTLRRSPSPRRTTTRLRPTDMSGNAKAASPPPRAHSSNTPPQHPCSIPARSGNSPSITMRTDSSRSKRVSIRTEASFRTMKALISTRTKPRTTARRSSEPSWISRVSQKKR